MFDSRSSVWSFNNSTLDNNYAPNVGVIKSYKNYKQESITYNVMGWRAAPNNVARIKSFLSVHSNKQIWTL